MELPESPKLPELTIKNHHGGTATRKKANWPQIALIFADLDLILLLPPTW
jgi:hypothetical protein